MDNPHHKLRPDRGRDKQADPRRDEAACASDNKPPSTPTEVSTGISPLIHLRINASLRPRDWRTQLATAIAQHPDHRMVGKLSGWADGWVQDLLQLGRHALALQHPLEQARSLLSSTRMQLRVEVEARLLAGQTSADIASTTGLDAAAIDWYEAAFYCCRDRLHAGGYIVHRLLGALPPEGTGNSPPFGLLPWFGFFAGPIVVDLLLEVFRYWRADRRPALARTSTDLSRRALRLRARASLMARGVPVHRIRPRDILKFLVHFQLKRDRPSTPLMGPLRSLRVKPVAPFEVRI